MICLRLNQLLESKVKDQTYDQDPYKDFAWMIKTGGYAKDMTLREHFAAVALQGLLASETNASMEEFVTYSYEIADAMLEAGNAA